MDNNYFLNISISIFAGILTYVLIGMFKQVLEKILIPRYQAKIYKGLDISGIWIENHNYKGLLPQESEIKIKQNAHKINGTITLAKKER